MADYSDEATDGFIRALFNRIDNNVTAKEAQAAKAAVTAESNRWLGSYDWGGVANALILAAFNAIADVRNG